MKKQSLLISFSMICLQIIAQDSGMSVTSEVPVGTTRYNMQTNKSCQNRIYRYSDGTIGAIWMFSQTTTFDDRGTGYNYFNGSGWGAYPVVRIETIKSGWPSYAPYNTGGEIVVSHQALLAPLNIMKRNTRGSGAWTIGTIPPPAGVTGMLWAQMVTNGSNHMNIHVIANTAPVSNGGTVYQGLDGAVLYNRSLNGGTTWQGWQLLPGMTSSQYRGFAADTYQWANPKGDTLCFVVGDSWNDLFIMKSVDNGATWTKTIAWNCNYNLWSGGSATPAFYCPDGSNAVALDNSGNAHVVFGRLKVYGDNSGAKFYYPYTDGLIYWNETQPQLLQSLDSTSLAATNQFIGWVQDPAVWLAGATALPYYWASMSSMPSVTIDQNNHIYVIWSGVTNNRDPYNYMLRHIFSRSSVNNGASWCPSIVEITSGAGYSAVECVYPALSPTSTDNLYFVYQADNLGGCYIKGLQGQQGQNTITINDIRCQTVLKSTINCGIAPTVNFSATPLNPVVSQTVAFTDLSANYPTSWQWSFSPSNVIYVDATSSVSQNPHVQFTAAGVYSVTLTATNVFGTGSLTKTNYITVSNPPPPIAAFIADKTSILTGEYVQFTDMSTGNPTSWQWSFQGGTPASWNGQNPPPVQYLASGAFDVSLIISNAYGSDTVTNLAFISVTDPPPPVADFTGTPTTLCTGGSVQFTDLSTGSPATWAWTFEGGVPSDWSGKTPPPVVYGIAGSYDVTLIVTTPYGSDTLVRENYVSVIVTGITEEEQLHLQIYPNPAEIRVWFGADRVVLEISLWDMFGKCRLTASPGGDSGSLDLAGLPAGIYFLKAQKDNVQVTRKLVIR